MNDHTPDQFRDTLFETGLVAIIRCKDAGLALPIGRTLVANGVRLLEVTLTTPDALEAITTLSAEAPEGIWVGAGTVITADDVERARGAGARFAVTPGVCPAVAEASAAGLPTLAGAWTASEVIAAVADGATAVKIFPASSGGVSHFKALRDPLPHVPLTAVGGVGLAEIPAFREVGAVGFGIGGPLVGDAARGGSLDELAVRARQFVEACRA
ncbi:bifunctional 4-hydroxy-2-oxoglutarate aldolase/2-dehydro-3-deoxy-phosphogluconate aldolase [Aestuariimicrobium sp. Y1814]|uniref:bifunctional 4-hydroxy-2-oxoglutarate aldolase/2-dehydro-3-deoxy-phosphogluconate aldolase n=1 Tax=Aestuariimicrobium sp. Y1814 TaxID=3418742 RepID=UPI003DA79550